MHTTRTTAPRQVFRKTSHQRDNDSSCPDAQPSVVDPSKLPGFDFRIPGEPWEKRREFGKSLREKTPRESHAEWQPAPNRPDPITIVMASNAGRQAPLIPLRMEKMAASPFAFLRGAAAVMAQDLAKTPATGLNVVIDGDAHVDNFGLYGTPQRDVVFDLNDFDEVIVGPWEWDLKRLTASLNVLGQENGLTRRERRRAVTRCVAGYRWRMEELQGLGVLEVWYLHTVADRFTPKRIKMDPESKAIIDKAVKKARKHNNASLLAKVTDRSVEGTWHFKEAPPELTALDGHTQAKIIEALNGYAETVAPERHYMLHRYHVVDVVHRVVGIDSIGLRVYLALLFGNGDDDPLFLQIKEARPPTLAPYVSPVPQTFPHEGLRIIQGQRLLQASSDPLLGWTSIDGRPFYVRQMKNLKGSIPMEWLTGTSFNFFAWSLGTLLARAHARTGDAAVIAGYCGGSAVLDEAFADWAEAYGDQTAKDHAALLEAIKSGRVVAGLER